MTGASLGIGRAVAEELAREGCDVAMVARTEDTLRRAADDIARASGRRVIAVPADASVPEAITNAVQRGVAGTWRTDRYPGEQCGIHPRGRHRPRRFCQMAILDCLEAVRLCQICATRAAGNARPEMGTDCQRHRTVGAPATACVSRRRVSQCGVAELHQGAGRRMRQRQRSGHRRKSRAPSTPRDGKVSVRRPGARAGLRLINTMAARLRAYRLAASVHPRRSPP